MRKRLGADRKSADGIVVGLLGQRRPEGNEQVRLITISRCGFFGHQSPYGDQPVVAVVGSQWLESSRQVRSLKTRTQPPSADPHARWCGRGPVKAGPYPDPIVMLRFRLSSSE